MCHRFQAWDAPFSAPSISIDAPLCQNQDHTCIYRCANARRNPREEFRERARQRPGFRGNVPTVLAGRSTLRRYYSPSTSIQCLLYESLPFPVLVLTSRRDRIEESREILTRTRFCHACATGGEPSTRSPPGELVEQLCDIRNSSCLPRNVFSNFLA